MRACLRSRRTATRSLSFRILFSISWPARAMSCLFGEFRQGTSKRAQDRRGYHRAPSVTGKAPREQLLHQTALDDLYLVDDRLGSLDAGVHRREDGGNLALRGEGRKRKT